MNYRQIIRRIILIGAPLLLGVLEIWHPAHVVFGDMVTSSPLAEWWLTLHVLQLPLFGLLAVSLYLLLDGITNGFATVSRIAIWFFVVFYIAFDSIAGIATGIFFTNVQHLQLTDVNSPLFNTLYELFLSIFTLDFPGGVLVSQMAVVSWFVAGLSAAAALYMQGLNRLGVTAIVLATIMFHTHAYPNGPIAMFLLTAGIALIEFSDLSGKEIAHE